MSDYLVMRARNGMAASGRRDGPTPHRLSGPFHGIHVHEARVADTTRAPPSPTSQTRVETPCAHVTA